MPSGDEDDDRPELVEQRAQRLADRPPEHAAGVGDARDGEALRTAGDVEDSERRETDERPADDEAVRARRAGVVDEGDAHRHEHDRQDVATEAGEGAGEPLDAVAEDAGEVEVDAGGEEDGGDDDDEAEEVVLAPGDRPAQLTARLLPPARLAVGGLAVSGARDVARARTLRAARPMTAPAWRHGPVAERAARASSTVPTWP